MARDNPLHDHPRSKKDEKREAKKGDRETDSDTGEEWESQGTDKDDDATLEKTWSAQEYPRRAKVRTREDGKREWWGPPKKTEVPTS